MLDTIATEPRLRVGVANFDVEIAAVATAVPPNFVTQDEMKSRAREVYPQFAHIDTIYSNSGVDTRYICEAKEWYQLPHTWEERCEAFERHALDLLERVTLDAVEQSGLRFDQIDAIVVNTTTGFAVPSLDARLINRLRFAPHTERLPIFGLGCAGGVAGLARASRLAQTMPGCNVLFLTIDLCTLWLRINDPSIAMFVGGAIFGDGAAAVVLRNAGGSDAVGGHGRVVAMGEHLWPDTGHLVGHDIKSDGFGIVLSLQLPRLLQDRLGGALDGFLDRNGLTREGLAGYLLHPGGGKILDVAHKILNVPSDALKPSRETLRTHGNMSSATAIFVLKYALETGRKGRQLLMAFGPGLSVHFLVLDL